MSIKNAVLILTVLAFVSSPFFIIPRVVKVESISCISQYGPCNSALQKNLQEVSGKTLFEAKKEAFGVLESDTAIEDFSVQFKLPNKMTVDVVERKPYFALKQEDSSVIALLDNAGVVVSFQEDVSLPKLFTTSPPPNLGESVDTKTLFAAQILLDMHMYYQAKEGTLNKDSLTFDLMSGETVIFPLEGDRQILIASLTAILSRLKQEGDATRIDTGNVKEIDLRFTNPVLR